MGKSLSGKELGNGFSQRKDGRYEARAMVKGHKIYLTDSSLRDLKKRFEQEKADLISGKFLMRESITLGTWFEEWFEINKRPQLKSEMGARTYKRKARNTIVRLLGDVCLENITQMVIQSAANDLIEEGYKVRSVKEGLGVLRECLDIAVLNHLIDVNPCVSINIKDENEAMQERRVLTHWEQVAFLEEASHSYYNEAYQILLLTGMRIGEFSGLWWSDIDYDNQVIHINRALATGYFEGKKVEKLTTPKTSNAYREIPFFGETAQLFRRWKEKQDKVREELGDRWRTAPELGDLVFTSTMGSPVSRYVISHDIEKVVSNMRLKEVTRAAKEHRLPRKIDKLYPHAFRHTFATRCFEKGMDPLVVQSIMGHANYATTISYTHVLRDKTRQEADKIGDFLK